jgi:hypothetical protein
MHHHPRAATIESRISLHEIDDPICILGFAMFLFEVENTSIKRQRLLDIGAMDDGDDSHLFTLHAADLYDRCREISVPLRI